MARALLILGFLCVVGLPALAAPPDSTFSLKAHRRADTVLVSVTWLRKEKDKIDVRLDVVDFNVKIHKSFRQKLKVGSHTGGHLRFVLPSATELGLDTATYYYALSAVPACNCEEAYGVVPAFAEDSYAWPEPGIELRVTKFKTRTYIVVHATNVARGVHLKLPPGNPTWRLESSSVDVLPGQDVEVEVYGIHPALKLQASSIGVEHR